MIENSKPSMSVVKQNENDQGWPLYKNSPFDFYGRQIEPFLQLHQLTELNREKVHVLDISVFFLAKMIQYVVCGNM